MTSLFKYSLFEHKVVQTKYVSFNEWIRESQMNAVLLELSRAYPETRFLYNKYLERSIGYIDNKLNKYDIIYNYINFTKSDHIE